MRKNVDNNSRVVYAVEPDLKRGEFVDILRRSTLSERRPVNAEAIIEAMLRNASVIVTARIDEVLVGVARSISDFAYCTYVSDLAVDVAFQRQGIGKRLLGDTQKAAGEHTTLILLAAPAAEAYYPHIGMQPHNSCWIFAGRK